MNAGDAFHSEDTLESIVVAIANEETLPDVLYGETAEVDEKRNFVLDYSMEENPSPHWWSIDTEDGIETNREERNWGRLPFIILKNNYKS